MKLRETTYYVPTRLTRLTAADSFSFILLPHNYVVVMSAGKRSCPDIKAVSVICYLLTVICGSFCAEPSALEQEPGVAQSPPTSVSCINI